MSKFSSTFLAIQNRHIEHRNCSLLKLLIVLDTKFCGVNPCKCTKAMINIRKSAAIILGQLNIIKQLIRNIH